MKPTPPFNADTAWPLWDSSPIEDAFILQPNPNPTPTNGVISSVSRPWLFGYKAANSNNKGILILGGGGYVELMVGREGVAVAQWLASLGFNAFVLVHRFPNSKTGAQAPLDDAHRAMRLIEDRGFAPEDLGICGLSSGGHLAAALLASYPASWKYPHPNEPFLKPKFAIVGYGPVSTNAVDRTIIKDKAALEPPEKQELYNVVQPDVQLLSPAPPTFVVYSGNDPVVPVTNAYRLAEGITKAGGAVELHIFADAPHGFGIDTLDLPVSKWPQICEAWMKQLGLI